MKMNKSKEKNVAAEDEKCTVCFGIFDKEVSYPTLKNIWFLGDKAKNQIVCAECQIEAEEAAELCDFY